MFLSNRDGRAVEGVGPVADALAEQLARPVHLVSTVEAMAADGVTDVVVVGPGSPLRGLIRATLGGRVRVHRTDDLDDLRRVQEVLRP